MLNFKNGKMKSIRVKILYNNGRIVFLFIVLLVFASCNENEFLEEKPLDFYAPENSFVTYEQFETAIYNLHASIRDGLWGQRSVNQFPRIGWYGTDMVLSRSDTEHSKNYEVEWGPLGNTLGIWELGYRIIFDANVVIGRSESEVSELNEEQRTLIQAEAKFFRAYMYNIMANLYGGVPIVLEEIKSPRRDFVRASREEVYEQCAEDLEFAVTNLPDIDEMTESRINKLAASHVLTEVYISLERWQDAIDEATIVIDHPATVLMTQRFGNKYTDVEKFGWYKEGEFDTENYGDIYNDLFVPGNQDRYAGNTESIWVLQYEYNVEGGGDRKYELERFVCPRLPRSAVIQSDGSTSPILPNPNTYYCGRGQGFLRPSNYFFKELWKKSGYDQDIRNSKHNIIRDLKVNNPNNEYHGKWVVADNVPLRQVTNDDTTRVFYPIIAKVTTPGKHPQEFWDTDQSIPGTLIRSAEQTWRKHYMIRLAETYLLRAEAYLGKGELAKAAQDINMVRRRAKAPDVQPADVDIDYILDERLRELHFETLRIVTLARLGKIVERNKQFNPIVAETIKDHQNLWAIPFSEINKNVEAELEQNPGY
jgi:starch-binding outer membrane protein, SusD/RagB family